MDLGLTGRVVVVAAAGGDEGRTCARTLAAEGAAVVLVTEGDRVEAGDGVEVRAGGLAGASVAVEAVLERHGRVDAVVACHSPHVTRNILDIVDPGDLHRAWDAVVDTVALYRAALPSMMERRWGRLVCVTTSAVKWLRDGGDDLDGVVGLGLLGMHKAAVADAAPMGVTANAVLRGDGTTADDVASLVAFLVSDRAGYLDGVAVALDGASSPSVF